MRFKIKTKMTILLFVFGLLPLLSILPIVMGEFESMKNAKSEAQTTIAKNLAETVDRNLFERYGDVQAFGLNTAAKNEANWNNPSDSNPLVAAMNGYMANYGLYKLMLLVSPEGQLLAVNSKDKDGKQLDTSGLYRQSFKDEVWLQKAIKGDFLKGKTLTGTVVEDAHYSQLVSSIYKDDGFVLTFAAPVHDEHGKVIAVWANFADFGLVEEIVLSFYEKAKASGMGYAAFGVENKDGIALINFDPELTGGSSDYKRDSSSIGKQSLSSLHVPAAEEALKAETGNDIQEHEPGIYDVVGWSHSTGAYDFPGLGWVYINHTPSEETFADIIKSRELLFTIAGGAAIALIFAGLIAGTISSRSIIKAAESLRIISTGNAETEVYGASRGDEIGEMARAMEATKHYVSQSSTLQTMIDNLSLPVMLCDKDYKIIYVNKASLAALKSIEKLLPVSADKIVGSNIDIFHKNPAHQRKLLADHSKLPHQAKFPLGDQWLSLNANQLPLKNGKFDGAFVDWRVITDEVRNEESVKLAQSNIHDLIEAATKGDIDKRIDASQFEGFYRDLAGSMNSLMDTVANPIRLSIDALTTLSKGDLTKEMEGEFEGAFADIQTALNNTVKRLKDIVIQIVESSDTVSNSAGEISAGSTDLSSRTEQQASNLEETAASMEELTATVRQNTDNSDIASKKAASARIIAEKGGDVVANAVTAMNSIEQSSQKISDIIGVIDEIAFQTNLLALNAAVEAARAGEAGKGFAVVASEVRSLAGRSASASKEIKQLISESGHEVKSGAKLVNEAGETLKEIVNSVKDVADIMQEIASASAQQSSGIDEINSAVAQMDEMTQQNAALVEENTAAAQSLSQQATQLRELMKFFNIGEGNSSPSATLAISAPTAPKAVAGYVQKPKPATVDKPVQAKTPKPASSSIAKREDGWEEF